MLVDNDAGSGGEVCVVGKMKEVIDLWALMTSTTLARVASMIAATCQHTSDLADRLRKRALETRRTCSTLWFFL